MVEAFGTHAEAVDGESAAVFCDAHTWIIAVDHFVDPAFLKSFAASHPFFGGHLAPDLVDLDASLSVILLGDR